MKTSRVALILLGVAVIAIGIWSGGIAAVSGVVTALVEKADAKTDAKPKAEKEGPPVETVEATDETIPVRRRTIGSVISKSSLQLTSNIEGMVVERVAAEGSHVKAGDVIARLDDRTAKALVAKDKATLQRDQATLEGAGTELTRQQGLAGKNVVSVAVLETAQTSVLTAKATIALDQAILDADLVALDHTQIRAPFNGRLGSYAIAVGSIVQPASAIIPLTQLRPIDVSFQLPEADLGALRAAGKAGTVVLNIKPSSTMAVTDGGGNDPVSYTGKMSFIDNQVDALSGTFTAKATIDNDDLALWPGQSVTVDVVFGEQHLPAVPTVAVQQGQNGQTVYVLGADGKVSLRKVEVGLSDGDKTGIRSGLKAGERVVTQGQIKLADGMAVKDVTKDAKAKGANQGDAKPGDAKTPDAQNQDAKTSSALGKDAVAKDKTQEAAAGTPAKGGQTQ